METKNLFFNIFIFLALVKLSVLDDKKSDFIIMGVDSYKKNANNITTFRGLLKNLGIGIVRILPSFVADEKKLMSQIEKLCIFSRKC